MNTGQIHYALFEKRAFLKLAGTIRYPLSQRLSLAVGKLFSRTNVEGVVIDLQEADFIDSTCLGLLARVATRSIELKWERPVIVSTHAEVNRQLRSMGFDQIFILVESPADPAGGLANAAELAEICRRPDPRLVLDAHRALCEINEHNRGLFQNVLDQLEPESISNTSALNSRPTAF